EVPARGCVEVQVVARIYVVKRRGVQLRGVLADPVERRVGEPNLAQAFLFEVLVDQGDGGGPQRRRRGGSPGLPVLAAEHDVETCRRIGVSRHVRQLAQAARGSLHLVLLKSWRSVELAGTNVA